MNEAQKIDYAYYAERLPLLIARRQKLSPGSDLIPALDIEMISTAYLVWSYRLVGGHESHQTARQVSPSDPVDPNYVTGASVFTRRRDNIRPSWHDPQSFIGGRLGPNGYASSGDGMLCRGVNPRFASCLNTGCAL
jgi:hypothetical protein